MVFGNEASVGSSSRCGRHDGGMPSHTKKKNREYVSFLFLHCVRPYKKAAICKSVKVLDRKTDSILLALDLGPPSLQSHNSFCLKCLFCSASFMMGEANI